MQKSRLGLCMCTKSASIGAVERGHKTLHGEERALRYDLARRTGEDCIPGHCLFEWMVRHAGWGHNKFQPHAPDGLTTHMKRFHASYKGQICPFGEIVMIRVVVDPSFKKKLDSAWFKLGKAPNRYLIFLLYCDGGDWQREDRTQEASSSPGSLEFP